MQLPEQETFLLTKIGFTKAQAQLFLTLHRTGGSEARTIAKKANIPRQEVYRVLNELQEKGLIEKIISTPQAYRPIPLQDALAIIVNSKAEEYKLVMEKTREFLASFERVKKNKILESDYMISAIEGRKGILLRTKRAHLNLSKSVDCCTTCERWTQVGCETAEAIKRALDRGVKYRTILDKNGTIRFPKQMSALMANKNYKVRLARKPLKINVEIFDEKEASLNLYPSKNIDESPMLWTNHLSLLTAFQAQFENDWATAEQVNLFSQKKEVCKNANQKLVSVSTVKG